MSKLVEPRSVDRFIAFFDVLGWKSLVRTTEKENDSSVKHVVDVLNMIKLELQRCGDFYENNGPEICPAVRYEKNDIEFRFTVFSDNVVLSAEVSPAGIINLLNCCFIVYFKLFARKGLMCRGYVKRGLIYHTSDCCVGSGLSDVVEGEKKVSIFNTATGEKGTPFIEIDRNIIQFIEDEPPDSGVKEMFSQLVKVEDHAAAIFPFTRLDPGIFGDGSEGPDEKRKAIAIVRNWIDKATQMVRCHVDPSNTSALQKGYCLERMLDMQSDLCDRMEEEIGEETEMFPADCFTPESFPGLFRGPNKNPTTGIR